MGNFLILAFDTWFRSFTLLKCTLLDMPTAAKSPDDIA